MQSLKEVFLSLEIEKTVGRIMMDDNHFAPTLNRELTENRVNTVLSRLKHEHTKAVVPYLPVGYPTPAHSLELLHALVDGGADMIELGVPFSDPMADGPIIQRATEIAIEQGMTLRGVLQVAASFRQTNDTTPLVMMTYANPIESMGWDEFIVLAVEAGIDALLLVDLPPEELGELKLKFSNAGLLLIHFVAPTSKPSRVESLAHHAQGFVYYVALKGVTGSGSLDKEAVNAHVYEVQKMLGVPVLVGFGIQDGESAKAVSQEAAGVIVGTALVKQITSVADQPVTAIAAKVKEFVQSLRVALDSTKS